MPMQTDALASVYARSLYDLAEQAGGREKITEVAGELEQIIELTRTDRAFGEFMASPIIGQEQRGASLRSIFTNRVTDLTLRFLLVLNDNGRLGRLDSIGAAFDSLVQEAFGRVEVDVFTAAPLGRDQMESIKRRIQQALGREPVLHPYTEASMIGGLKLRIGDQLIDGSVASKLRRLKRGLMSDGAARVRERFGAIIDEKP